MRAPKRDRVSRSGASRRRFLRDAAAGAAAIVATPLAAQSPPTQGQSAPSSEPSTTADVFSVDRPGADFMVDIIKSLGFEYVAANPGSSFAALHESIVNYGGNRAPELLTCLHEESSVAMAHGYAKIEGKPMMVMAHGTVGLQHAAMAVYNAYADRVPIYIVLGNILDAQWRRSDPQWAHAVQDCAAMVRDCTKWDDTPASLVHFAESGVRAYKIAMTPPHGPVILVADATMQEEPIPEEERHKLRVPKLAIGTPPAGDQAAVNELATLLVAANDPVIITGRAARTAKGLPLIIELAELLQAPVRDPLFVQRMNFPSGHRLRGGNIATADLVLGLEVPDFYQQVNAVTPNNRVGMSSRKLTKAGAKIATISSHELLTNSNYQDFGRYNEVDLAITADAEATLPSLIEACRRLVTPERKRVFEQRGAKLAEAAKDARDANIEAAAHGWEASPISTARLSAELWHLIKGEDWSLVSDAYFVNNWPLRLWDFTKHYQYIGWSGAYGIGYGAPAAVGAALANRKHGRISVNIQCDGDLNYAPGVLWTAAHHKIPLLTVMHNNRAYHMERMYITQMAARAGRDPSRANIGNELAEPFIDYVALAKAYGVFAVGPVENPVDLGPAIKRALDVVKKGEPALVDVITQGR